MSATQIVLAALVLVAFVLGWFARGRRQAAFRSSAREIEDLDRVMTAALTAFQAALALWQIEGSGISSRSGRAVAAFEQQRRAVDGIRFDRVDLSLVRQALAQMASELELFAGGAELDPRRERLLLRAERTFTAARAALLRELAVH